MDSAAVSRSDLATLGRLQRSPVAHAAYRSRPGADWRNPRRRHRLSGLQSFAERQPGHLDHPREKLPQAIERLITLAKPLASNAYDVVAEGIQAVICQELVSDGAARRLHAEPLLFTSVDSVAMRDKIAGSRFTCLRTT